MAAHNEVGKLGESLANHFLSEKGYCVIAKNYRYQKGEIDLIAYFQRELIFVEVKTRNYFPGAEHPETSVDQRKQNLICQTADFFLEINRLAHFPARFDIVSVELYSNRPPVIVHLEDCFRRQFILH
jgi:putative endonuclease